MGEQETSLATFGGSLGQHAVLAASKELVAEVQDHHEREVDELKGTAPGMLAAWRAQARHCLQSEAIYTAEIVPLSLFLTDLDHNARVLIEREKARSQMLRSSLLMWAGESSEEESASSTNFLAEVAVTQPVGSAASSIGSSSATPQAEALNINRSAANVDASAHPKATQLESDEEMARRLHAQYQAEEREDAAQNAAPCVQVEGLGTDDDVDDPEPQSGNPAQRRCGGMWWRQRGQDGVGFSFAASFARG